MPASLRRWSLLAAFACGACFDLGADYGTDDEPIVRGTAPGLLQTICDENAYTLEGAALRRDGLTADTCAFELGPGDGAVTVRVDGSLVATDSETSMVVSALVVDLYAGDATNPRWKELDYSEGSLPAHTEVAYRLESGGQHIGVVELGVTRTTLPPPNDCSVSPRGIGAPRRVGRPVSSVRGARAAPLRIRP